MSKMGISTVTSYCGAQVFEAIGLDADADRAVLHRDRRAGSAASAWTASPPRSRPGTPTRTRRRTRPTSAPAPRVGGEYQWRRDGEVHLFNPETVFLLQHATRSGQYDVFKSYTKTVDELAAEAGSLRGLFTRRARASAGRSRSTRSSRSRRSSSGSPPAR